MPFTPRTLHEIAAEDRGRLAPLFEGHRQLPAIRGAVLEGVAGQAWADDPESPSVARLDLGCYSLFGGDPESPAARALARAVTPPQELVWPEKSGWRRRLLEVFGARLADRPMRAFALEGVDIESLKALTQVEGPFRLARMDALSAAELSAELEPHALQSFGSVEAFLARGIGFCALAQGGGAAASWEGPVACAATSYAVSAVDIEVAIACRPAFRRRGLATATAARLVLHCLELGRAAHWNASNPVSQHLACRLGFRPAGICQVLYLEAGPCPPSRLEE